MGISGPSGGISRRIALSIGAAAAVAPATPLRARDASAPRVGDDEPDEMLPLWPGMPPGAPTPLPAEQVIERAAPGTLRDRIAMHVARPQIAVFRAARPSGAAVLVIPGGGFVRVAIDKEGYETARWLRDRGVTAFVLRYRFPGDGWQDRAEVPLQDAQRAMRLIRARAARYAIDPRRLGAFGFSAGGHIAAMLAVAGERPTYGAVDAADRLAARPAVLGLMYALISMATLPPTADNALLGPDPSPATIRAFSADRRVSARTPPTILFQAGDDATVSPDNNLLMYAALRKAGVPAELHLFETGGHGFGLRLPPGSTARQWPDLFLAFAARHGV